MPHTLRHDRLTFKAKELEFNTTVRRQSQSIELLNSAFEQVARTAVEWLVCNRMIETDKEEGNVVFPWYTAIRR